MDRRAANPVFLVVVAGLLAFVLARSQKIPTPHEKIQNLQPTKSTHKKKKSQHHHKYSTVFLFKSETMAEIQKVKDYFGIFDGTGKSWAEVESIYDALFAKDVDIATHISTGNYTYDTWADFVKNLLEQKAAITLSKVEAGDGSVTYAGVVSIEGKPDANFGSVATFKDGKVVKITPS